MSLVTLRKCPIEGCAHNLHPVYADKTQTIKHILNDHDYLEKLESAVNKGIIHDISERRNPKWLAEALSDFSLVSSENQ